MSPIGTVVETVFQTLNVVEIVFRTLNVVETLFQTLNVVATVFRTLRVHFHEPPDNGLSCLQSLYGAIVKDALLDSVHCPALNFGATAGTAPAIGPMVHWLMSSKVLLR